MWKGNKEKGGWEGGGTGVKKYYLGASRARRLQSGRLKSCLTASSADPACCGGGASGAMTSPSWHWRFTDGGEKEELHATRDEAHVRRRLVRRRPLLPPPPPPLGESVEQFDEAEDEMADGEVMSSPSTLLVSELRRIRGGRPRPRRRRGVEGGLEVLVLEAVVATAAVVVDFMPRRTIPCGGKA